MPVRSIFTLFSGRSALVIALLFSCASILSAQHVHVTRFWHNHQPIYWPDWNSGVGQDSRVQYAHDSMRLKPTQNYGAPWNHPHNDLEQIFGLPDRVAAYQARPRNALTQIGNAGGFGMSYTGSLIDNIRNLADNGWNYGSNWNAGNTEARGWMTPSGSPRMDLVGFSYHHSLTPLLPKEVFRKEVQIFKQAWWKAWGGNPDLSDHSRGFFPTEMAYSRDIIDVLVDEGYDWVIVASHHLSRTSPSYMDRVTPSSFGIKSSPPNRADLLGPRFDNPSQWWFAEPNPGQAAWNVAPFAYQLHRVKYIDPETGDEKTMIAVPSDDVLSYQAGYSGAQIGVVDAEIAPHAGDASRPALVMPATDGDNAWGGGFDSWEVSTPQFFGAASSRGYTITSIQDFVDQHGGQAPVAHVEEGAWIYPEMCYGSPYFLKWIEPPVRSDVSSPTVYPNTIIDVENGWSLKFFAYAPKMAGANWVITAGQIWRDQGGSVEPWKIQAPYDWGGSWTSPNVVELAWHIYLKGLDSGFQYYGGLGNDDEVKPGLAARRAIETLQTFMDANLAEDRTGPTVLKPQRFPYNPGGYTFGWFNSVPGGDTSFLKRMGSEFYIWTLVHDVSGVDQVNLKIRRDKDGVRSLANNHNETYAGGDDVEDWITLPMTRRVLPNTRAELNALAGHGEIDYVVTSPEIADQYFVRITDDLLPGFRDNLFDYYVEAVDNLGNVSRSDIQHVFVEDDEGEGGGGPPPAPVVTLDPAEPTDSETITITYNPANRPLAAATQVYLHMGRNGWQDRITPRPAMALEGGAWVFTLEGGWPGTSELNMVFTSAPEGGEGIWDNNGGQDWHFAVASGTPPNDPPATPTGVTAQAVDPTTVVVSWNAVFGASGYTIHRDGGQVAQVTSLSWNDTGRQPATQYTYQVAAFNAEGSSGLSSGVNVTTPSASSPPPEPIPFVMDGVVDFPSYLLAAPGMTLYAAVRGDLLYVATWSPSAANGNDHFILVTDELLPSATTPAPWAKSGTTASPPGKPFLAAESENDFINWFNVDGVATEHARASGAQMEGTIDLAAAFGGVPEVVYFAAAAYQTDDGGTLSAQAPTAVDANGNIDPEEYFAIPLAALRDENADGVFDRIDPAMGFRITGAAHTADGVEIDWNVFPGKSYTIEASGDLSEGSWQPLHGFQAGEMDLEAGVLIEHGEHPAARRFFRVRLEPQP